jgi:hypothetical protein
MEVNIVVIWKIRSGTELRKDAKSECGLVVVEILSQNKNYSLLNMVGWAGNPLTERNSEKSYSPLFRSATQHIRFQWETF